MPTIVFNIYSFPQRLSLPEGRGTLVYTGCAQWEYIGRRNLKGIPSLHHYLPRRISSLSGIRVAVVASHCSAAHSIIISEEGKAFSLGTLNRKTFNFAVCVK